MQRRGFFRLIGGASAAWVLLRTRLAAAKRVAVGLDKMPVLKEPNTSIKLKVKDQQVLFVRDKNGVVHAIDPECTHKKCQVDYSGETGHLHCKCHKSAYTLDGKVLGGPAPKPLNVFKAALDGERVVLELPDPEKPQ